MKKQKYPNRQFKGQSAVGTFMSEPLPVRSESAGSVDTFENPCHPASVAYRITMSPHEWTWTQEEIEAMARWIVKNDNPQNMGIGGKLSTYDQY